MLGLNDRVNHSTFYMGDLYSTKVVEVIPDFQPKQGFMEGRALNLRMDYHFDEQNLIHWLQNRKINLLTEKPINLNLLKYFKNILVQLTVNINDSFTTEYLTDVKNIGINVEVFCEEEDKKTASRRFRCYNYGKSKEI